MLVRDQLYIGGEYTPSSADTMCEVISPRNEEVLGHAVAGTTADMDRAVAAARQAFDHGPWPRMALSERVALMTKLHEKVMERNLEFTNLISEEMGSPSSWSMMAQGYASWMILDYYLKSVTTFPFEEIRQGYLSKVLVRKEPVGVVAAIVPWNTPQFVLMSKIAPALLAGCTVIHKPDQQTPFDGFLLADIFDELGFPPGVYNVVPADRDVSAHLVSHPGVDKIGFTGSVGAGKAIAAAAGANLSRVSLELGGKSAAIILPDVDLDTAIAGIAPNAIMNNGEACVAQTRVLAHVSQYDDVVNKMAAAFQAMKIGDPMEADTEVGPQVHALHLERVEKYIALGQEEGAEIVTGGRRAPGFDKGYYLEPTLFANVDNSMRIAQEEIFGPVVCVIPFNDLDDAVRISNDSDFGLHGTVWTDDHAAGLDVARRVRTGVFGINTFSLDFGAPFGGFKNSGLGREMGVDGLTDYLEMKTIIPAADVAID